MPVLYLFFEEVQAANRDITVWLIKNNTSSNTQTACHCEKGKRLRNVQKYE